MMDISHCGAHKLNVPRIMLPYFATTPINFTLEGSDGCYSWHSLRPEVASVQPIDLEGGSGCSQKALVTALSTHSTQMTSVVFAEEEGSGQVIRCDVIVDNIDMIDIVTTTRVLYLGDSPEEFEVRALDDEGNTFSSLEGLEFEWTLLSDYEADNAVDAKSILRIVQFKDLPYDPPAYINVMESRGKQGDRILIEGLRAGSAKVGVRLKSAGFKDVKQSVVRLIVIDHLTLNPAQDIYILVHAYVKYTVEKIRQGKTTIVPMPSAQYRLALGNTSVASLTESSSTVVGLALGHTQIMLQDRSFKDFKGFKDSLPSANVYVIEPAYLGFVIVPGENWVLETGRYYEITIDVYDRDSNKMFPSDIPNIRIETVFPPEYFEVIRSSQNGSHHYVRTVQSGVTEIDAALVAMVKPDGELAKFKVPIKETQEAEIFDPIEVRPEYVAFAYQPGQPGYQFPLKATGGTGSYVWSSSKRATGTVNVHGLVTTGDTPGMTNVTAADNRNPSHYGLSRVYLLPPSKMVFLDSPVEAVVGSTLHLPLGMEAYVDGRKEKVMLTHCGSLPLTTLVADQSIFQKTNEDDAFEAVEGSCTTLHVKALAVGHTQVTVTLQQGGAKLQASVTIAAFAPLEPLDPESIAVVSLAASKTLVLSGGPQPWVLDPSRYYQELTAEEPSWVKSQHIKGYGATKNYHIFQVLCRHRGEQTLTVSVGNHPTTRNKFPATSSATVKYLCTQPVSLQLVPVVQQPDLDVPCPIALDSNNQIPVMNGQDMDILVRAVDSHGHLFHNFSSLVVSWSTSDHNLASFYQPYTAYHDEDGSFPGSRMLRAVEVTTLKRKQGSVTLTATTTAYDMGLFRRHSVTLPNHTPSVSASLELGLVMEAHIDPNTLHLFNHPSNKALLNLHGGSGHFLVRPSVAGLADIRYNEKRKQIEVTPLHDGSLTITAYDLCIATTQHASAQIHMAGVHTIDLKVVDKVQVEHEIRAAVQVLDATNQPLSVSYFPLMGLEAVPGSNIITLRPDEDVMNRDQHTAYYTVYGANIGFTTLAFVAMSKTGHTVSSKLKDIQVFPPLKLSPRNITLLVSSLFQVRSSGGPQPQSQIEYIVQSGNIAKINSSGILHALNLGHTRVTGRAVGYDQEVGSNVIYSEDVIDVYVIELLGIRIHAPLHRLESSTVMPVYAMGLGETETPFTFGDAIYGLQFDWSVSNSDIIDVEPVFAEDGIYMRDEHNVAMRVRTKNPGEASLRLQVSPLHPGKNQIYRDQTLMDEIQIQVFERLELMQPPCPCHSRLLMTPNTQAPIRTNRDGSARMSYRIHTSELDHSLSVSAMGVVTAGPKGGHASVEVTAYESFGVNQTTVVHVKVKPVSYIAVHSTTGLTTQDKSLTVFPVGVSPSFAVRFYDNIGEPFDATNVKLDYRLHRFDRLQLQSGSDNMTLIGRSAHMGTTLLKVWDSENPWIDDYVSIPVGSVIRPEEGLVVGDIICLGSPLLSQEGQRGSWSSSDNSIIKVQRLSGVAMALSPGTVTLTHHVNLVTSAQVSIGTIVRISLEANENSFLSSVPNDDTIYASVKLNGVSSVKGENCGAERLSQESITPPFQCELQFADRSSPVTPSELFHVTAGFNPEQGTYYCSISQLKLRHTPSFLSTMDTSLILSARLLSIPGQRRIVSDQVAFTFLPAYTAQQTSATLTLFSRREDIGIEGVPSVLTNVQASTNDTEVIALGKPYLQGKTKKFPVALVDSSISQYGPAILHASVELSNTVTGQQIIVPIKINLVPVVATEDPVTGWASVLHLFLQHYQTWLFFLIFILAVAAMVLICYHVFLAPRYYVAGATSGAFLHSPAPGSPVSAPPPYFQHSPGYTDFQQSPYASDSIRRRRAGKSPTKLWSTAYSPQEGASPHY
ncbi:nuclear pore membrane glycoprotein 210-like [Diadema antillarum]|uniref:nuclear pore membrane glycoprotein 210-like n=1 Tax=Diadema antillarum TaxID=105358 RepID=UPI003A878C8A